MSNAGELERSRDGFESSAPTPMLSPSVERLCDAEGLQRFSTFQELFDLVSLVFGNHVLCQQICDDRPSFTLVPICRSSSRSKFAHVFATIEHLVSFENKYNFTVLKRYTWTSQSCKNYLYPISDSPRGKNRDAGVPLTVREDSPTNGKARCEQINSTTRNQCLITDGGHVQDRDGAARADGGTTAKQVLDDNGVGQKNDYEGKAYGGSEAAIDAIEAYVADHVADKRIASSRSIANTATDVRIQEIGKTLGAHLRGDTPDGFLADVEVSKWRDTSPVKWVFTRVAGEADTRRSRQLQKPDLVREITRTTDAGGARYEMVSRDGTRWEKANTTVAWKRDVLAAVCETTDHQPAAVDETEDLDRREWIDQLTQAGATDVLERAIGIEAPGARDHWNRETLQVIHDVVVAGRDLSEVGR